MALRSPSSPTSAPYRGVCRVCGVALDFSSQGRVLAALSTLLIEQCPCARMKLQANPSYIFLYFLHAIFEEAGRCVITAAAAARHKSIIVVCWRIADRQHHPPERRRCRRCRRCRCRPAIDLTLTRSLSSIDLELTFFAVEK